MLVSILVPTYRRPGHLREALASIAQQDRGLIGEVLVGDNSAHEFGEANQAEIAASRLAPLVTYIPNHPPKGNYPNQWSLAEQARFDHVLILHDDDHLRPGGLAALVQACEAETDKRVKIWFGRNLIMDESGKVDLERSAANTRQYGKDGPACAKPVWAWCLTEAIPPNTVLIGRGTYLALMRGDRDGNAGDWGFAVRLANSGAWARFIDVETFCYRLHSGSLTRSARGIDVHLMYELALQLQVPQEGIEGKKRVLRKFAEVATARYLRDGERINAWRCFISPAWRWSRRLSPRGMLTLGMLLTPSVVWRWALAGHR